MSGIGASEASGADSTGETIRVVLNGRERDVPEGLTIRRLLELLELEPALVVVERNREIVERDRYDDVVVKEEDELELVHFVGGG